MKTTSIIVFIAVAGTASADISPVVHSASARAIASVIDSANQNEDRVDDEASLLDDPYEISFSLSAAEFRGGTHRSFGTFAADHTGPNWTGSGFARTDLASGISPLVKASAFVTNAGAIFQVRSEFSLDEPTRVVIDADAFYSALAPSNYDPNFLFRGLSISIFETDGPLVINELLGLPVDSGTIEYDINSAVDVPTGDYTLWLTFNIGATDGFGHQTTVGQFNYDIGFQPIPAPAAATLLGFSGMASLRRRRRF